MGNYEIDISVPFVRLKLNESEYEYIVSKELYGEYAHKAVKLFEYAYDRGRGDFRRDLRKMLNI